jgi:hypothetical protein
MQILFSDTALGKETKADVPGLHRITAAAIYPG